MARGGDAFRLDGIRVLVVDDDEVQLELVTMMLEERGATVKGVTSATAALEGLERERPHVLVADILMPEHDGLWLIREVRALPPERGGKTPAAALTGLSSREDRARLTEAGFEYHIAKPVAPVQLAAVVSLLASSA